jgi:hypothetical protein
MPNSEESGTPARASIEASYAAAVKRAIGCAAVEGFVADG